MTGTVSLRTLLVDSSAEFPDGPLHLLMDHEALYEFLEMQLYPEALAEWEYDSSLSWQESLHEMTSAVVNSESKSTVDQNIISHTHFLDKVDAVYKSANFDLDTLGIAGIDQEDGSKNFEDMLHYAKQCCDVATEEFGLNRLELSPVLQQMRSKILLIIFGQHDAPVPLLTKSYLADVDKCWARYPDALKEVSVHAYCPRLICVKLRIIVDDP